MQRKERVSEMPHPEAETNLLQELHVRQLPPMMGQPPPIHLWELYALPVSLEPKGGAARDKEADGSRRGRG